MSEEKLKSAIASLVGAFNRVYEDSSIRDIDGGAPIQRSLLYKIADLHSNRDEIIAALNILAKEGYVEVTENPFDGESKYVAIIKKWIPMRK